MTRKDYINIAGAILVTQTRIKGDRDRELRNIRNLHSSAAAALEDRYEGQLRGVRRVAAHLAEFLKDDNPAGFDQAMFLKNCGYGAHPAPLEPQFGIRRDGQPEAISDIKD